MNNHSRLLMHKLVLLLSAFGLHFRSSAQCLHISSFPSPTGIPGAIALSTFRDAISVGLAREGQLMQSKFDLENVEVSWFEAMDARSHPQHGIFLGRQLGQAMAIKAQGLGNPLVHDVGFAFVLAHEYAHQFQFRHLASAGAPTTVTLEMELQADLLAGYWMGVRVKQQCDERHLGEDQTNLIKRGAEDAIAEATFMVGEGWIAPGTHGTKAQRVSIAFDAFEKGWRGEYGSDLTQFKPGLNGNNWMTSAVRRVLGSNSAHSDSRRVRNASEGNTDERTDEDSSWIAVDSNNDDGFTVERKELDWGDKKNGKMSAQYSVKNDSDDATYKFQLTATIKARNRDTREIIKEVDRQVRTLEVKPGKQASVDFDLRWVTPDWEPSPMEMPAYVGPDSDKQLLQVWKRQSSQTRPKMPTTDDGWNPRSMRDAITRILEALPENFRTIRAEPTGETIGDAVEYRSSLVCPDFKEITIKVDKDVKFSSVEGLLYNPSAADEADNSSDEYRKWRLRVPLAIGNGWAASERTSASGRMTSTRFIKRGKVVSLIWHRPTGSRRGSVQLNIQYE